MMRTFLFCCLIAAALTGPLNEFDTCKYKGKQYDTGQSFDDQCRLCYCSQNGQVTCTSGSCYPIGQVPVSKVGICKWNGRVFKTNDKFWLDPCNLCFCASNNMFLCTKRRCPVIGCQVKNKIIKIGKKYNLKCFTCICTKYGSSCKRKPC